MSNELWPIIKRANVMLLELAQLLTKGPRLTIVHRFGQIGLGCHSGEEVAAVYLETEKIPLPLQLVLRLLFQYLATHRHMPQSAAQIAAGMNADRFYNEHGMNSGVCSRRHISRSAVREYVKRARAALQIGFDQSSLGLDPYQVLASVSTMGNETRYQLRASVEWVHIDDLLVDEE
jgi:hypothetical protein